MTPAEAAAAIEAAVPGARVEPRRRPGMLRSLRNALVSGRADTAELVVHDGLGSFALRYPAHPGLLVDRLVAVVDVAVALRARFGAHLAHLKAVSIDTSSYEFRAGQHAGHSIGNLGSIHLNAADFLPDGRSDAQIAGTTAHELWHQIEAAFDARRYRDAIEFRRLLGAYFGVDTIERAVTEPGPAHDRLVAEVSAYAATKAVEATAEMAELWWLTRGRDEPPAAARAFAAAVERFFPSPPTEAR